MTSYRVAGMTCDGCAKAVARAIEAASPGARVVVDRGAGKVEVDERVAESVLQKAVEDAGFEYAGRA
ncbi:MAG: heavy-metal-associated domain-containing protein [Alphaproteobacteria bacterium]|nr:heavy-metal-associated domain-containing protein [Alphaproteobacteria bacterium]